jgi:phosphate transport system protein
MRSRFDEELLTLNKELIRMGALCEDVISLVKKALTTNDKNIITQVNAKDGEIDRMERDIESLCLKMILRQQPIASDLRKISAALKMITDMERIGDQASDIAEIMRFIDVSDEKDLVDIPNMASVAIEMVTESIDAYVKQDVDIARKVIAHDDIMDEYFSKVRTELIKVISEEKSSYVLDLMMIAKYFERIGDHATNIAEWVVFSVTGEHRYFAEE